MAYPGPASDLNWRRLRKALNIGDQAALASPLIVAIGPGGRPRGIGLFSFRIHTPGWPGSPTIVPLAAGATPP